MGRIPGTAFFTVNTSSSEHTPLAHEHRRAARSRRGSAPVPRVTSRWPFANRSLRLCCGSTHYHKRTGCAAPNAKSPALSAKIPEKKHIMTSNLHAAHALACLLMLAAMTLQASAQTTPYGPHVWDSPVDPATFEKRINEQLDLSQKSVDQLLAVKRTRTLQNTLAPYDDAVQHLDTAYYQSSLMQIVNPDAAIRDRAQAMVQKVSAVATALALNQSLYKALASLDVSSADAATKYYVQRSLLEFRLAGVDKDEATRARIKTLNDEITKYSAQFQRNLAESRLTVVVKRPQGARWSAGRLHQGAQARGGWHHHAHQRLA